MAIDFTHTNAERVDFGSLASVKGLQNKSVLVWVNADSATSGGDFVGANPTSVAADEFWSFFFETTNGKLGFFANFNTTDGRWLSSSGLSNGVNFLAVTYNYTSTSNDPILYVQGVPVSITEGSTPAGSYLTGTNSALRVGAVFGTSFPSCDGKLLSLCIYNRILSSAEIADAYASRLVIPTYRGLVFAPNLMGAAGGVVDGGTLGSTNYITDIVSGTRGTPSGSPVLRADTHLTME